MTVDYRTSFVTQQVEDGVYLWGALVTDRSGRALVPTGYRAFVTWGPLGPAGEAALFGEFWGWLGQLRSVAAENSLGLRAYCYNAAAEDTQTRRIAATLGSAQGAHHQCRKRGGSNGRARLSRPRRSPPPR